MAHLNQSSVRRTERAAVRQIGLLQDQDAGNIVRGSQRDVVANGHRNRALLNRPRYRNHERFRKNRHTATQRSTKAITATRYFSKPSPKSPKGMTTWATARSMKAPAQQEQPKECEEVAAAIRHLSRLRTLDDRCASGRAPNLIFWINELLFALHRSWRRGRDSNPRYPYEYAAFRVRCFQPLSHLSKP